MTPACDVPCERTVKIGCIIYGEETIKMANVGDKFHVGTISNETGRYKHSACLNTEIFNKGDKLAPCAKKATCPNTGADWILQEKLT